MIPKVDCCVRAIQQGVQRTFILDGRIPHCLLLEIFTDKGIGTVFYKGDYNEERGY
jgi:acetylglutamate kinase